MLNQIISLDLQKVSLKEAIDEIGHLGGLGVMYREPTVIKGKRVTLELNDVTVLEALYEVVRGTNLRLYLTASGQLLVVERPAKQATVRPVSPVTLSPVVGSGPGGTIAGRVTEASTGQGLPGVNVVIDGTTTGASTDIDGYYRMLNVPPGTYSLRASYLGYASLVIEDVRVNIDRTTEVDFALQEEAVGLDEVVVTAEQPVVQRDISGSRIDVSADDIENLPVADVTEVVGMQAGVQGLSVRGSDADELGFVVDGFGLSGARDNTAFTEVSYTAIQEVQLQSGGFGAEYGDIRSGIVNVVTKEGPRDHYTADMLLRYSSPSTKYFGASPSDPNSYWMRPYLDDAVAWDGTENGGWDEYTRKQFPNFVGFNAISEQTMADEDPNNDLTPQQAQELFLWQHRRDLSVGSPDYTVDASVGGPVPGISRQLGGLRFFASYRQKQDQYIIPLSRDGYTSQTGQLKLTSDIGQGKKLTISGMSAVQRGASTGGGIDYVSSVRDENREFAVTNYGLSASQLSAEDIIFGNAAYSVAEVRRNLIGARFTHALSGNTYYDLTLQRYATRYDANPPAARDSTIVKQIGNLGVDEGPFGYSYEPATTPTGMTMGPHLSVNRDSSVVEQYQLDFDLVSQLSRHHQLKTGVEFELSHQDIAAGQLDYNIVQVNRWNTWPIYAAFYAQDKIEYRGMIANVGLRLDYQNPNTEWYVYDDPYDPALLARNADEIDELLEKEPVAAKINLSPRLGVSFPVTESSKLYFNYGHFYQTHRAEALYLEKRNQSGFLLNLSNPHAPLQKTIAYELGYEQGLFGQFLVRVAGYYKDVSHQSRWALFENRSRSLRYQTNHASNYEDIRGFEISLFKNQGRWIQGFVNYTYMVHSTGNFGYGAFHQDRLEQKDYEAMVKEYYQSKPIPQPYARANLEFVTPPGFGPSFAGINPVGDWRISLLGRWRAGNHFTWTAGQQLGGVRDNVQWADFKMVDLRLSKNFSLGGNDANFYIDVNNVFNLKNLNHSSFYGPDDFDNYMNSLHLPQTVKDEVPAYTNTPGNDRPGDMPSYVDPPNGTSFRYLYPRDVFLGLRISL